MPAHALFALTIASCAAIANWVAFGPGPRACAGAIDVVAFTYPDLACRAGFGIGSVLLDGFVLWMVAASLRTIFGPGALPNMVEGIGIALMLLALVPIVLPLLLIKVARVFVKGCATWRATAAGRAMKPASGASKPSAAQSPGAKVCTPNLCLTTGR